MDRTDKEREKNLSKVEKDKLSKERVGRKRGRIIKSVKDFEISGEMSICNNLKIERKTRWQC